MTKRKWLTVFLSVEALLCVGMSILRNVRLEWFGTAIAFPFYPIGVGLRKLSLWNSMGNGIAWVIYLLLCLLPAGLVLLDWWRKRRAFPEDGLLLLLTPALFYGMYQMINPGLLFHSAVHLPTVLPMIGGILHSLWVSWLLLRLLRCIYDADSQRLYRYLAFILYALAIVFVYAASGQELGNLLTSFEALQAGNVGNEASLGLSYVILVLGWLAAVLPYLLDTAVIFSALALLDTFRSDRYSTESTEQAERLARLCGRVLSAIILTDVGFNLIQLVFLNHILVMNVTVSIPIVSIAFVLAALMLARMCADGKRLKDENDSFI